MRPALLRPLAVLPRMVRAVGSVCVGAASLDAETPCRAPERDLGVGWRLRQGWGVGRVVPARDPKGGRGSSSGRARPGGPIGRPLLVRQAIAVGTPAGWESTGRCLQAAPRHPPPARPW